MEILSMGEKIRRRRKSLRLTLRDVAGDRVTPAQLSYVESDKCKPSMNLLKYICERIGLEMDYVLESESQQAEKYCRYFLDEYEFYTKRGKTDEAEDKLTKIEELANEYGLFRYLGIVKFKKGESLLKEGTISEAEDCLLNALQIFMRIDDAGNIANCYNCLGIVALERNYPEDAMRLFKAARELIMYSSLDEMVPLSKILLNLAKANYMLNQKNECIENISTAMEKAKNDCDDYQRAELAIEAAYIMGSQGMIEKCDSYLNEALEIYSNEGCLDEKNILIYIIKAIACIRTGDMKGALNYCDAIINYTMDKLEKKAACFLLKLCHFLIMEGYQEKALSLLDWVGENTYNKQYGFIYNYLKSLAIKSFDKSMRDEYLAKCSRCLDETKNTDMNLVFSMALGEMYSQNQNYSQALFHLIKGARMISAKCGVSWSISDMSDICRII